MRRLLLLPLALAAGACLLAAPALAGDRDDVERERGCTGRSTVELKLSEEDGRIEVEVEVDQNCNGVRWRVVLRQRGKVVVRATRRTRPPSGSFELRRVLPDRPGRDRISARATEASGEVCRISAVWPA